jgi:hypothetical protein
VKEGSDIEVDASIIEKFPAWINPEVDDPPKKFRRRNTPPKSPGSG